MELFIFRPTVNAKDKENTPGILWIHGGGYVTGMAKMIYISRAIDLVKKYGAVVVTPEYRLSKAEFEKQYLEACKKYYADQNNYSQGDKVTDIFNAENAEKDLEVKYEI